MPGLDGARVLVTGATGLIGSVLVRRLLEAGAEVHILLCGQPEPESALTRSGLIERITLHAGCLEDAAAVRSGVMTSSPAYVFHLGAQSLVTRARRDPVGTFEANVGGTWRLLDVCRALDGLRAVVVASSDKAYGRAIQLPYSEAHPIGGVHEPYEASKALTDIVARSFALTYRLPVRVTRCGNVYGPGDWNWSRLIPGTIRSLLRGERPVIRSDGTPLRDFVHVDDVADAYLRLAVCDVEAGEAFNFSSGERLRVLDVVALIQEALGTRFEPDLRYEATEEIPEQWLDATKAQTTLGWRARRRLRESLPETLAWYRELVS